ncbi:AMP-binding protein [Candidatus Poribacteria bacterium]
MADWLIHEEITIYYSVPTTFRHFIDTLTGAEEFPRLRIVSLGGEPVYRRDLELYKEHFSPDCLFLNGMGTTETGSFRRYFADKNTRIGDSNVPIGYPVAGREVLLLDENGEKLGFNQTGEIAVKGRYLSLGYWKKPDLTQARFLPDPEGGDERIYLTGDLGIMQPDGCLTHLGRKDFQVKIGGHRVEIAEIEMALLSLDVIRDAVVAQEISHGDQRLVAYLVPVIGLAPTVSELRRSLAEMLPDYMIPSAFMMLDALPLTPTGKVDRLSLPLPGKARPDLENPFAAPRTPIAETLAGIWSQVLELDQVGIHDDFFELGGNSLLATQIISRVLNTFQVKILLRSLLQSPTVTDMAAAIAQSQAEKAEMGDIEQMLAELDKLSEDKIKTMLDDENR